MRTWTLQTLLLVLLSCALISCNVVNAYSEKDEVRSTGEDFTRKVEAANFTNIRVSHGFEVDVKQAGEYQVAIEADKALEPYLEVSEEGNTLKIGLDPEHSYQTGNMTMKISISTPSLSGIELSGTNRANLSGIETDQAFEAKLSGNSQVRGDIVAATATFNVSGNGAVILTGGANKLTISSSGNSNLDLRGFVVIDAEAAMSGSCQAWVYVRGRLDVRASGDSRVVYAGDPTLGQISLSGSSTILAP